MIARVRRGLSFELALVSIALLALIVGQLMMLGAIHGTNFGGADGKMAQAIVLTAQQFNKPFHFNSINPTQGLGSQLLPMNVWLNPVYWPFAFFDKIAAPDLSSVVALSIFSIACYAMARCFDVPILPSLIAAQLSILMFAPILFLLQLSTVFTLMVGNAVVYAPYMAALGLLARIEPGSNRAFILYTAGIFILLFYSICCDPLWSIVNGLSWAVPFALVTISPIRPKAVLIRVAALACCGILLLASGGAEYLYTLVHYTARFQFPGLGYRVRAPDLLASALFYSPHVKTFYLVWIGGWVLGLLTLRGRMRVLVLTGILTCAALFIEIVVYLLIQNTSWSLPLPVYTEQSLFSLFIVSAVAGYWGSLEALRALLTKIVKRVGNMRPGARLAAVASLARVPRWTALPWRDLSQRALTLIAVALLPLAVANYVAHRPGVRDLYNEPWAEEPELADFLSNNTAQAVDRPFRGAVLFYNHGYEFQLTNDSLWIRQVPTILEYSQLVTPQSFYFNDAVLKSDVSGNLNGYLPRIGLQTETFFKALPALGTRYFVVTDSFFKSVPALRMRYFEDSTANNDIADQRLIPVLTTRQGAHFRTTREDFLVYEVRNTNVGNYSPTQVMTADSGAAAAELMTKPQFDFTTQAVLSEPVDKPLVPARDMQMTLIRGGWHLTGHSSGTSLVILPQQFSHCLRAQDEKVRLVRADLMLTGVIFSGDLNTDIVFDYGVFTPSCRRADLADIKQLNLQISRPAAPLSNEAHRLPSVHDALEKLRAAVSAIKYN